MALRKAIAHERSQGLLFHEARYLFYITNRADVPAEEIVEMSNKRCNQERTIGELKSGVNALSMPLGDLHSNWAYMVISTLAWNLSRWVGLVLPAKGRWKKRQQEEKERVSRMRFRTFAQALISIPTQVTHSSRRLILRVLDWGPYRHVFFRGLGAIRALS